MKPLPSSSPDPSLDRPHAAGCDCPPCVHWRDLLGMLDRTQDNIRRLYEMSDAIGKKLT